MTVLGQIDGGLRERRDFKRLENGEMQECTIGTMFGSITIKRRIYFDLEAGERVALLDRYLEFSGSDALSPFLTEMAVKWAVKGPSYRDSRDRFSDLLGYQAMSHEKIRQEVLKIEPKEIEENKEINKPKRDVDVLFLEVDGLHVHKQNSTRSTREVKIGIAHEGWGVRHPSSNEYVLQNKSYWHTLGNGEEFWEAFSRHLYEMYRITEDTFVVINGDRFPCVRSGDDYFQDAIYVHDHYHTKKWIKRALSKRTKQERRKAYLAADERDPVALLVAVAEAENAEVGEEKKEEIKELRLFIHANQRAFSDYRTILQEKGIDVSNKIGRAHV